MAALDRGLGLVRPLVAQVAQTVDQLRQILRVFNSRTRRKDRILESNHRYFCQGFYDPGGPNRDV